MAYNPKIHHRKSIRLKGYDYSQDGLYFVTICCENRICRFGNIKDGVMHLNEYGEIAYTQWVKLAERFNNYELDVFQIMPNHMHGIIVLNNPTTAIIVDADNDIKNAAAGAPLAGAPNDDENHARAALAVALSGADSIKGAGADSIKGTGASPARTGGNSGNAGNLGDIVGAYKSIVANECLKIYKSNNERMGKLWQRNYYEIIIRNEKSYARISEYIINNPAKWDADKFYH